MPYFSIAQFSDSHLFADKQARHHGADVYQNLADVCQHIANNDAIDVAVFTGDLTQDHSQESYQRFATLVKEVLFNKAVYFVAGNHDELAMLNKELAGKPFHQAKSFSKGNWQFHLLHSKSATPAGFVDTKQLSELAVNTQANKAQFQFCFMHHHPVDVGYFIDRHGLTNQDEFWQVINHFNNFNHVHSLKGIACGHVHRAIDIPAQRPQRSIPVYACPATSIKFACDSEQLIAESVQPGYRLFDFHANGEIKTQVIYL